MNEMDKYSKEVDVALVRTMFGMIPIVGSVLNEVVFDIRGRVKQDRLNKFTELFAEYFVNKPDLDIDVLRQEDFGDLFEAVLRNVAQTKSDSKYKRYRDILTNKIEGRIYELDNSTRYLELVASLEEIEIQILNHHMAFDLQFKIDKEDLAILKNEKTSLIQELRKETESSLNGYANNKSLVKGKLDCIKLEIEQKESKYLDFEIYKEASFYGLSEKQFAYFKQNLYSKALLIDTATGGDTYGYVPFAHMGITEFGKEFLNFLKKED